MCDSYATIRAALMLQSSVDLVEDLPKDLSKIFQGIRRKFPTFSHTRFLRNFVIRMSMPPRHFILPTVLKFRIFSPFQSYVSFHRNFADLPSFPESVVSFAPCELRAHPESVTRPFVSPFVSLSQHRTLREIHTNFFERESTPFESTYLWCVRLIRSRRSLPSPHERHSSADPPSY
jgi:hypothetical protein